MLYVVYTGSEMDPLVSGPYPDRQSAWEAIRADVALAFFIDEDTEPAPDLPATEPTEPGRHGYWDLSWRPGHVDNESSGWDIVELIAPDPK